MAPDTGLAAPVRRLATAAAAGVAVGLVAVGGLTLDGTLRGATETTFAFGALALGVGLLGWSGSVMAGRGIENMQRYMDTGSDWTESDSRRAMTRIIGFGVGVMFAASLATALL
ncbi:DUF7268 family protein [Haloarchaeobius iranensis]|uniref:Uncharacterized protein n=1 Tax=Haloarchaeobius iranensis TaxID=996166 RepID=A0A1G9XE28_9EURY|nr:hypothetical protein [Haloarchaeobius iranensis]SDM94984.1 hypothetical protein SAMN05192554_11074 [Haloarchaeobius iranensis]